MNATIEKFGYPATLVAEYDHWVVLLRQKQMTAASLVLACKEDAGAFSAISAQAFAELKDVTGDIETCLAALVRFERINYVMLMMVDPHVHFHVLPRHSGPREIAGITFGDATWPKPPDFASGVALDDDAFARLHKVVAASWRKTGGNR